MLQSTINVRDPNGQGSHQLTQQGTKGDLIKRYLAQPKGTSLLEGRSNKNAKLRVKRPHLNRTPNGILPATGYKPSVILTQRNFHRPNLLCTQGQSRGCRLIICLHIFVPFTHSAPKLVIDRGVARLHILITLNTRLRSRRPIDDRRGLSKQCEPERFNVGLHHTVRRLMFLRLEHKR